MIGRSWIVGFAMLALAACGTATKSQADGATQGSSDGELSSETVAAIARDLGIAQEEIRYIVAYGSQGVELGQGNVPGPPLYDHDEVRVNPGDLSTLTCEPKGKAKGPFCKITANGLFVVSESSPAKCRQCSIGATGYLQCKFVRC